MTIETTTGDLPKISGNPKIGIGAIAPDHPADRPDDPPSIKKTAEKKTAEPVAGIGLVLDNFDVRRVAAAAAALEPVCSLEPPLVLNDIPAELPEPLLTVMMRAIRDRSGIKNVQIDAGIWSAFSRSIIGCPLTIDTQLPIEVLSN